MSDPPHDFDAEQGLLGALLLFPDRTWAEISEITDTAHFADPLHALIFDTARKLLNAGQMVSPLTLRTYMDALPEAKGAGGSKYLARLASVGATAFDPATNAALVRDLFLRRQILTCSELAAQQARHGPESAAEQLEALERQLYDLGSHGTLAQGFTPFASALASTLATAERAFKHEGLSGLPTGLADLDQLLGGLNPSDLIVIAGRPSMGKTALATSIAFNVAKWPVFEGQPGTPVGFFSLEMSSDQLTVRLLGAEASVPPEKIRRGTLTSRDFDAILSTAQKLEALPLYIDQSAALSIASLRSRARRLKRQHGLGLLIVDYLQLITSTRTDGRVQEVSEITRGLKTIAKELSVPVIALSQLSRDVEKREDKRPLLSDLRDSGSIEQDADVVIFVYRPSYYLDREEPVRRDGEEDGKYSKRVLDWQTKRDQAAGRADLIIAKARHGPTGQVRVAFDASATRFTNIDEPQGDKLL